MPQIDARWKLLPEERRHGRRMAAAASGGSGDGGEREKDVACVVSLRWLPHFEVSSCGKIPCVVACVHTYENRSLRHWRTDEQRNAAGGLRGLQST
jgi:hypothetical protein